MLLAVMFNQETMAAGVYCWLRKNVSLLLRWNPKLLQQPSGELHVLLLSLTNIQKQKKKVPELTFCHRCVARCSSAVHHHHPQPGFHLQTKATTNHLVPWIENVQLSQLQRMQPRTSPLMKIDSAASCYVFFFLYLNLWPQMEKHNQVCCHPSFPQKWAISDLDAAQSGSVLKALVQELPSWMEGLSNGSAWSWCCSSGGCCGLIWHFSVTNRKKSFCFVFAITLVADQNSIRVKFLVFHA